MPSEHGTPWNSSCINFQQQLELINKNTYMTKNTGVRGEINDAGNREQGS